MQIDGKLTKWNDERGFGFITPAQGGQEIFVHISVFPKDGQRPHIGESLSFEIEIDNDGKKRAKSVSRPLRANASYRDQPVPTRHRGKYGLRGLVMPLFILGAVGVYGYGSHMHKFSEPAANYSTESAEPPNAADLHPPPPQELATNYSCDGRTHCSQMTSCTEAEFFLQNCPGTQMDGDNDGVPCEQQWCSH